MHTTFKKLSVGIERCSQMLPNKMQCPKAGVYEVVESSPILEAGVSTTSEQTYQLCLQHARILNSTLKSQDSIQNTQEVLDGSEPS